MFKKGSNKSIFQIIAWICLQVVLLQTAGASDMSYLAPVLNLETSVIQQGFVLNHLNFELAAGKIQSAQNIAQQELSISQEILATKALLADLEQVMINPDSVVLPQVEIMSDFHGEIDLFLKYIADVIFKKTGNKVTLDHTEFPNQSISEQLAKQGFDWEMLKSKKVKFHLLGDFSDRGRYGMKCFRAAEELKAAGLAEVVTGNHDLLELMASMGYHLPIHKGYNLYGHKQSEDLVFKQHWDDPEIAKDRVGWWSIKLGEFVKQRKAMQQGVFKVNGIEDIKDVREELKATYLRIKDQLDSDEQELWEDLVGFFFGTTDVSTGFNDIGMMSVEWWQERADKVAECLEQARKQAYFRQSSSWESAHEIVVWEDLKNYVDQALTKVETELKTARQQGKWWHQVFNDINHQTYTSPEWYAMDWIFHKGWGTSVIAELNELESNQAIIWDAANFMNNNHVQDFAAFSRDNFTLYLRDEYGFYYTHGWFPVNAKGDIEFNYKGVLYRNKDIWQGLDMIQADVRNPDNSFADLQEAFSLVMSWYADKTVKIKPQHIKEYIAKFGIKAIQEKIGARVWFTCHNPLNTLVAKGIMFKEQQGDYAHISVDKGMSWQKFKDVGGYVAVDGQGIKLRGFSDAKFTEIIDHPQTMTLKQDKDKQWTTIYIQENPPLARSDFLSIAKKQIKAKLQSLQSEPKPESSTAVFLSLKLSWTINSRADLAEQSI